MTDTLERVCAFFQMPVPEGATPQVPIEIRRRTRADLAALLGHLGCTQGAEVGVWRGAYSKVLCEANPNLHLYLVDPWRVHTAYRDHQRQDKLTDSYNRAMLAVAPYRTTVLRDYSVEAAKVLPDGVLDFVYIDGNHRYESCVEDLATWIPKVKKGGIIAGHDYAFLQPKHLLHVIWAVNGWTASYGIAPWFILGRGRDVQHLSGDDPNRYRSWFWVNR